MFKNLALPVFAVACLALATSCGVKSSDSGDPEAIDFFTVVSGTFTSQTRSELKGTGLVEFNEPLGGANSKQAFSIKADLSTTGSSITLIANASQNTLSDGIRVEITHTGGLNMQFRVSDGGTWKTYTSGTFEPYSTDIDVVIEVDNSGANPRVLVWRASNTEFTDISADIDTNNGTHGTPLTVDGTGSKWGMELSSATVTRVRLQSAPL